MDFLFDGATNLNQLIWETFVDVFSTFDIENLSFILLFLHFILQHIIWDALLKLDSGLITLKFQVDFGIWFVSVELVFQVELVEEAFVIFVSLDLLVDFLVHYSIVVLDAFLNFLETQQIFLSVSSALQLVFILNSVLSHFGANNFPGLAVDLEVSHEFLMELHLPEVRSFLIIFVTLSIVILFGGAWLFLFLSFWRCNLSILRIFLDSRKR